MPVVLICAPQPLDRELTQTLLGRGDFERHQTTRYEQALAMAIAAQPDLTLIDHRMPRAAALIQGLRTDPKTRQTSIAVIADGDFEPKELELLEAGANAILRLPPSRQWDDRLDRLLRVPTRRDARFAVDFTVEGTFESGTLSGDAVNLSAHGMLLQTDAPLSVGSWIAFAFRIPGSFVDGRGRVMRQAGAGRWGLYFEELTGDGRERVEDYVESLPAAPR